ncbi:hypothetical protein J4411_00185 [Candidatus Pacearchaeota archaeon]|nr:hypothetical protein [uncultured archaeon]MBS3084318.1 hypothetical protein [Candidatus Pacearchaeota archaeon]
MKYYSNLYDKIISLENLIWAYKKAKKGKSKKYYIKTFEENLAYNLKALHNELKYGTYNPKPLQIFILRDPKTRKISKSVFRDRIIHHAICNVIEPIFDKSFIYDSYANRKGKGTFFAIKRFEKFQKNVTHNFSKEAFCLKADVQHYFREIDRKILLEIVKKKIKCERTIKLIKIILNNFDGGKGMPLGNMTSQFFANLYLDDLDQFIKRKLRIKFYIRYVDDFVILHKSKEQLEIWKKEIEIFLNEKMNLELHPDKSKISSLSQGIDFLGFKIFYYFKILKKRNLKKILSKISYYQQGEICRDKILEIFKGWDSYAKWADAFEIRKCIFENLLT